MLYYFNINNDYGKRHFSRTCNRYKIRVIILFRRKQFFNESIVNVYYTVDIKSKYFIFKPLLMLQKGRKYTQKHKTRNINNLALTIRNCIRLKKLQSKWAVDSLPNSSASVRPSQLLNSFYVFTCNFFGAISKIGNGV